MPNEDQELAVKIWDAIKRRSLPPDLPPENLRFHFLVEQVRDLVTEEDIPLLMEVASGWGPLGQMGVRLLKKFSAHPCVRRYFVERWSGTEEYELRLPLMWRLLDDPDLPLGIHGEIHQFVINNLERYRVDVARWRGGPERVIQGCREDLANPRYPKSKHWAYIYTVLASPDREAAANLVRENMGVEGSFEASVLRQLLELLER